MKFSQFLVLSMFMLCSAAPMLALADYSQAGSAVAPMPPGSINMNSGVPLSNIPNFSPTPLINPNSPSQAQPGNFTTLARSGCRTSSGDIIYSSTPLSESGTPVNSVFIQSSSGATSYAIYRGYVTNSGGSFGYGSTDERVIQTLPASAVPVGGGGYFDDWNPPYNTYGNAYPNVYYYVIASNSAGNLRSGTSQVNLACNPNGSTPSPVPNPTPNPNPNPTPNPNPNPSPGSGEFSIAVSIVCQNNNTAQVDVTWSPYSGADLYQMYGDGVLRYQGGGTIQYFTVPANTGGFVSVSVIAYSGANPIAYSAPSGSTIQVAVPNCAPPPQVTSISVTVTGQQSGLKRNSQIPGYRAVVTDNLGQNISIGPGGASITWSLRDGLIGTISADSNPANATLQTGPSCRGNDAIIAHASYVVNGRVLRDTSPSLVVSVVDCQFSILGDIFGSQNVEGLEVGRGSVVSSSQTICVLRNSGDGCSEELQIEDYIPQQRLSWGEIQLAADKTIETLLREQAQIPVSSQLSRSGSGSNATYAIRPNNSPFNLNPSKANFEGSVWYIPGNLQINGPVEFKGRGTFIVNGTVTVNGSVTYQNSKADMLGVISRKSGDAITLTGLSIGKTLVGAYFAPKGKVILKAGLDGGMISGLMVGNEIIVDPLLSNLRVEYNSRITTAPPPGFRQSILPILSESAP